MKFRVDQDVLAEAVAWAARSLPSRPPVPVLAGVLMETGPNSLTLSSFDYEVSSTVSVRAEVADEGRALVSGRLLSDIARSLPDRPVDISSEATKVVLSCGSTRFTLLTLPVDDYPALPNLPTTAGTISSDLLATAIGQVAVAAGRDDTLPVLTGVRMEIDGERIILAATDRYRLAVRELGWKPEQTGIGTVALVPARTLADTSKTLAGSGDVTVALSSGGVGDGLIGFEARGRRTTSRLLDGEFPKYRSLLPAQSTAVATVDTHPFIEAVKRVSLVAERNTPVRLAFSEGEVVLEAGSGEEAQASEVLMAELSGDDISIAFNPTFLLDGLNAIETPRTRFFLTTPTKPAVLTGVPTGDDETDAGTTAEPDPTAVPDSEYRYLIMPIRLSG